MISDVRVSFSVFSGLFKSSFIRTKKVQHNTSDLLRLEYYKNG